MPLMREWIEIQVDEELLVPVVRELLDMAVNPNHVEVIHGVTGRVVLVEARLAEFWYQERLRRDAEENLVVDDFVVATTSEVVAQSNVPIANTAQARVVEPVVELAQDLSPIKRGPGRPRKELPTSASPDGEDS